MQAVAKPAKTMSKFTKSFLLVVKVNTSKNFEKGIFTIKKISNVFRPHNAVKIFKRNNHGSFSIYI